MTLPPDGSTGSDTTARRATDPLWDEFQQIPPAARLEWLVARAALDPGAVARLEALLANEQDDDFLEPGAALNGALFGDLCHEILVDDEPAPALEVGASVGRHAVIERIGRGGMGEVYRARDTVLGRDVALKVLPRGVVADDRRVARLRREARVLAALNHPNIAAIYDLEEQADATVLVLELVEGPTLGERCGGSTLPVDVVRDIARQIVDALEAAHRRGIVHRDLKPGNIKVDADGRVKVLDFGIATVVRNAPGSAPGESVVLSAADSLVNAVRGTTAYMCPEQLRGEAIDHRADIWAFGCVLFEMLAGVTPFARRSQAETLAAILGQPPAMDRLPRTTPPELRDLVGACLEKDVTRRLDRIGEARRFLGGPGKDDDEAPATALGRLAVAARRAWPVVLGLVIGAASAGLVLWTPSPQPAAVIARLSVPMPAGDELVTGALPSIALSPDGSTVVYRARRDGRLQLFRRALDAADPVAIADTSDAMSPFFSPDGGWVGFERDGMLRKVRLAGGVPLTISATAGGGSSSSWGERGEIVFAPAPNHGLFKVSASGGSPLPLTHLDVARGDRFHAFPDVLPGGRDALFTIGRNEGARVALVALDTGRVIELSEGRQARYLASGHILLVRGDALWAAPFDLRRRALSGEPRPVLRGLASAGLAHFAVSRNGSLAYVPQRERDDVEGVATPLRLMVIENWTPDVAVHLARAR